MTNRVTFLYTIINQWLLTQKHTLKLFQKVFFLLLFVKKMDLAQDPMETGGMLLFLLNNKKERKNPLTQMAKGSSTKALVICENLF